MSEAALAEIGDGFSEWFIFDHMALRPTKKALKTPPPKRKWESLMHTLNGMTESIPCWRADAYLLGEAWYGEEFASAIFDPLKWAIHTWQNNVSVRRRLGDRWHDNVDYSHHAEVAPLDPDEQIRLLDLAEKDSLRVSQIRQMKRELIAKGRGTSIIMVTGGPVDRLRKLQASACDLYTELPADWVDVRALLDEAITKLGDALEVVEDFKLKRAA